jgi:hypothetical protein
MGVMSKLLESHQAQPAAAITLPAPEGRSAEPATDRPWPSTWPAPAPCPACLSPGFWVDVYGGGPHCRSCNPPSSPSLVAMPAWVIGTPDAYRWVRNPKAEDEPSNGLAETDSAETDSIDRGEFVTWQLPNGTMATALRERVDHTRVAAVGPDGDTRRYSPALACGPVGDLTLDEWFDRLPEFSGEQFPR